MRRADRLFRIVQHLRGGRLSTAAKLAEALEVSERTIYRDIADLQASGVPIDGEAGVGYVLRSGFDLPPLMFTHDEITALMVGARLASAWGGARLALAAEEAMVKIDAILPPKLKTRIRETRIYAPTFKLSADVRERLDRLDDAIGGARLVELGYRREDGEASTRRVRPLGLFFWGGAWTLTAWCELRTDFRSFRIDRMDELTVLDDRFWPESGKTLKDFLEREVGADAVGLLTGFVEPGRF